MATFTKRGGKYQAVIRRKGFPTTSRTFHRKVDAQEWARHMEIKADRGDLPTPIRVLEGYAVGDILKRYRDEVTIKKRSADTETYIINALLREPLAKLTLAQINTAHFSKYREERLKKIKPGTVNRQFGIIRHAFDIALREWDIPLRENPLAKLRKLKVNDARSRRMKAEEWEAIKIAATACRNPFIVSIIEFALETALRRGELLAMEWEHINFENRTALIPITKNGHSRIIPLTTEAMRILRETEMLKEADDKFVFPVTGNATSHVWDRIMERAKINDLHFHDLRHESISRFFEKGLSLPEVALISGHRDYRMLLRYTHLRAEDIARKL